MPLVAHTQLPTYNNLRKNGHEVIPLRLRPQTRHS